MVDLIEKMLTLLDGSHDELENHCEGDCSVCEHDIADYGCVDVRLAKYLIANGVTFQKWIPVSERLPHTIPCGAGTEYSEVVNVLTSGRKVLTAIFDGTDFIADAEFWEADGEVITHWTPVLLPLPEPPKEV